MKSSLLQLVIGIGAVAAFASCSRFVAPSSYEEVQKESYKTSFETKYGTIPSNQKWDFSTYEVRLGTRGGSGITTEIMEKGVDFGDVSNLELEHHAFPQKPVWDYDIIKSGITKNAELFNAINVNCMQFITFIKRARIDFFNCIWQRQGIQIFTLSKRIFAN